MPAHTTSAEPDPSLAISDKATMAPPAPAGPILVASNISKSFPGVRALDGVSFDVRRGEVHALLGENGAGKSTLIKIMAGLYAPDHGEIWVDGRLLPADPAAAHAAGVATIHQDHHLVPNMNVAENILLGRWPTSFRLISRKTQQTLAMRALALVAPQLSLFTLARHLSPADGQLVEIARALSEELRVLVMDEPTSSLSPPEIDRLFSVVRDLQENGIGIVFVSHWLEEVFRIADRITVLRDGRLVGTHSVTALNTDAVIRMMVGRSLREIPRSRRQTGATALDVRGLTRQGLLHNISLTVAAGEIVCLAGLVGAGRSELANCIFGAEAYDSGEVRIGGKPLPPGNPAKAIRLGLGYVPEDRHLQALVETLSVSANATLAVLDRISRYGLLSFRKESETIATQAQALAIKMPSPDVRVSALSGGNQQKVVLARWLARRPHLLILDEPTKGVDVGAKAEISEIILQLAAEGVAILLISSEMPEVVGLSDRVLVMHTGRIVAELDRRKLSAEQIMIHATSG